jgi:hypothetical protein
VSAISDSCTGLLQVNPFESIVPDPGGRAAVIVPEGVLFGSSKAHKRLREMLVEEQKLDAIISLPSGVFRPYAGASTAILLFTKTNSGGTDHVWFYDMDADGWSLDDKRQMRSIWPRISPVSMEVPIIATASNGMFRMPLVKVEKPEPVDGECRGPHKADAALQCDSV